jgi:hypothetical protein
MYVCTYVRKKEHPCVYKVNILYIPVIPKQIYKTFERQSYLSSYFCFIVDLAELQDFGIGICISTQMRSQNGVGAAGLQLSPPPSNRKAQILQPI